MLENCPPWVLVTAGSAIVDLTFDDFGHVTGATTDSFDGR